MRAWMNTGKLVARACSCFSLPVAHAHSLHLPVVRWWYICTRLRLLSAICCGSEARREEGDETRKKKRDGEIDEEE